MNSTVDQQPFSSKKKLFEKESMYVSARLLASSHESWGENEILARSEELSDWAVERWPRPEEP
jgi:hypothetical protein